MTGAGADGVPLLDALDDNESRKSPMKPTKARDASMSLEELRMNK